MYIIKYLCKMAYQLVMNGPNHLWQVGVKEHTQNFVELLPEGSVSLSASLSFISYIPPSHILQWTSENSLYSHDFW